MARGPFQGTYRPGVRPTVVTAPDALVYINGETDVIGCPQCRRKFDLNKYITSIQVDLNVDSPPGSASISLSIPRHSIDDFYFDGNPLISPMMEVEIYAKGYYLVEGVPQYYPIFWGMTTEISDQYSGGEHTVSINCADILKWWELCKMNINPAFTQAVGSLGRNIFGNVFFGSNPYDVIWTLAQQAFGDVVVGSGSLQSTYKEANQKQTFSAALSDIMAYWNQRFSRVRSNLLLYGASGTAVRGDLLYDLYSTGLSKPRVGDPFASQIVRKANGGDDSSQMVFDPTDPNVVAFRTQFTQAGQVNFWQSEYQTKLELANAAKEAIGFEFYMDVDGSIVFKPPFYNLDVLPNKPVSWIQDIDVIDWDFSESEAEVVTQIVLQGNFGGNTDFGFSEDVTPFTSVTDYHLLRKYGWRQQTYNSEFLGDTQLMFYVGMDLLDKYNARRHRGTVNIPLRPELRLGFPIYIAPKDQIWYVQGLSHNIQFGGRAATTVTLTAKRQKFIAPRGIGSMRVTSVQADKKESKSGTSRDTKNLTSKNLSGGKVSFEMNVGEAAQLPPTIPDQQQLQSGDNPFEPLILRHPKTGRIVGYPNVVMAYTRPFNPPPNQLKKQAGQNPQAAKAATRLRKELNDKGQTQLQGQLDQFKNTPQDDIRDAHLTNRYTYGLNSAGVFTYCHDKSKVIREVIFPPKSRITTLVSGEKNTDFLGQNGTAMIRPVSDERGFEVIGHFRYGRGVHLRDGSLILNESTGLNEQAAVDTQVALSGGLFEMLSTQTQGISSVTSTFPNPADAIARLQPEDLETAGRTNELTMDVFVSTLGDAPLIQDAAPIGSLAQKGLPATVEAGQLSRALTLAEMSVKEAVVPNEECVCLTGRSDLAFINQGYQVKTLMTNGSSTDVSVLPTPETIQFGPTTTTVQDLEAEQELLEIDLANPLLSDDAKAQTQARLNQVNERLRLERGILSRDGSWPLAGAVVPSGQVLQLKIESFLANLYAALDGPHQEFEKALRGELIQSGPLNLDAVRFGEGFEEPRQLGNFSPPFNAPSRALGGDPEALAITGDSAVGDLQTTWNSFGNKLRSNASRSQLETEIQNNQRGIDRLQTQRAELERALDPPGVRVPGDVPGQLEQIDREIEKLQQQNAKKMNQLSQIPTT